MSFMNASKVMLRSLFSKPATAMYPVKKREPYAATRGSIENRIQECIFCGICSKKCPTGAIAVSRDGKSWEIDRFKCIACGACVGACPKKCLDMKNNYAPPATKKSTDRFVQQPQPQAEEKPDA
ncbi:Formate hydrogenlyase subunit 6/NADH:ubiquinone oxidoreductase subunit (chain I) [Sporobacter termitidis DSM 10068]|uniref:Formate hydrogenlyase subunit 6/NADH:ubiquinone oxidoreductase subunit (Chain I) n=1 Tax=Sporobacter termitidis DSM 10068 TaxID=1123282 RepID=A0A1M5Z0U9_9FIRM|nr:4Fe-4S binding protein [Sporobacter termitidis]SHI17754.1 Formate hydrogenlyase subunit 6/NADH:ubiquinone oxidoreductase subunit (chain I) [Sporobacter termitidis DSM 10068]